MYDIEYPLTAWVYPQAGSVTPIAVPATFLYSAKDPYAVGLVFGTGMEASIKWTFARDLLFAAIGDSPERIGNGDISFARLIDRIVGNLISPFGNAKFLLEIVSVSEFLAKTEELVPLGAEPAAYVNLDAEIEELLGAQ